MDIKDIVYLCLCLGWLLLFFKKIALFVENVLFFRICDIILPLN